MALAGVLRGTGSILFPEVSGLTSAIASLKSLDSLFFFFPELISVGPPSPYNITPSAWFPGTKQELFRPPGAGSDTMEKHAFSNQ